VIATGGDDKHRPTVSEHDTLRTKNLAGAVWNNRVLVNFELGICNITLYCDTYVIGSTQGVSFDSFLDSEDSFEPDLGKMFPDTVASFSAKKGAE